jgi:hypothetical protein
MSFISHKFVDQLSNFISVTANYAGQSDSAS